MLVERVVLVSGDLLFASRLRAALQPSKASLATVRGGAVPAADAVFVDLNHDGGDRVALIAQVRSEQPAATIVGFCGHEEKDVRRAGMAAGADQVVTNGALQALALRLMGGGEDG